MVKLQIDIVKIHGRQELEEHCNMVQQKARH